MGDGEQALMTNSQAYDLFRNSGLDTKDIAKRLGVHEAEAERSINRELDINHRIREARGERLAEKGPSE